MRCVFEGGWIREWVMQTVKGGKVTKIFEESLGFGTTSECGDSGGDRAEAGGFGRLYARP
jgi:hypothetical protein